MELDRGTTCEDFATRFDGFLDGEIDSHSMRAMALHASRCTTCGGDLELAEKLQRLLAVCVEREVDRLDTSGLWTAIEARLEPPRGVLRDRLREYVFGRSAATETFGSDDPLHLNSSYRSERSVSHGTERRWFAPLPALTLGGALAALVAALLWPASTPTAPELAANNHAQIERIESNAPHVAVWSEPAEHTTAIWVASYDLEGAR